MEFTVKTEGTQMYMTMAQWTKLHRDFKTIIAGERFRMWDGKLVPVFITGAK
jgi:hypothetical protein